MKTLTATALSLAILATPVACFANSLTAAEISSTMPVYEVIYKSNIDVVSQQTAHTLQLLEYQHGLEIREQARNNIQYIGARLHLHNQVAKQEEHPKSNPIAE